MAAIIDGSIVTIPGYIIMSIFSIGFAQRATSDLQIDPVTGEITGDIVTPGGGSSRAWHQKRQALHDKAIKSLVIEIP